MKGTMISAMSYIGSDLYARAADDSGAARPGQNKKKFFTRGRIAAISAAAVCVAAALCLPLLVPSAGRGSGVPEAMGSFLIMEVSAADVYLEAESGAEGTCADPAAARYRLMKPTGRNRRIVGSWIFEEPDENSAVRWGVTFRADGTFSLYSYHHNSTEYFDVSHDGYFGVTDGTIYVYYKEESVMGEGGFSLSLNGKDLYITDPEKTADEHYFRTRETPVLFPSIRNDAEAALALHLTGLGLDFDEFVPIKAPDENELARMICVTIDARDGIADFTPTGDWYRIPVRPNEHTRIREAEVGREYSGVFCVSWTGAGYGITGYLAD